MVLEFLIDACYISKEHLIRYEDRVHPCHCGKDDAIFYSSVKKRIQNEQKLILIWSI